MIGKYRNTSTTQVSHAVRKVGGKGVRQLHTLASCTKPTKRLLKAVGFYIKFIRDELGPGLDTV